MINTITIQREGDAWGKMLRSLRLKIAVVFSVLISMMFVILGTAMYQLQKEKEVRSLDQYSQNTMDLVTEQLNAFMQRIEEDMSHYGSHDDIQNMLQDGVTPEEESFILKEFLRFKNNHPDILDVYIGTKDKKNVRAQISLTEEQYRKDMIQQVVNGIKHQKPIRNRLFGDNHNMKSRQAS